MTNSLGRVVGFGTMAIACGMTLQMLGCASSSANPPLTLANNWILTSTNGEEGTGLTITKDNLYVFSQLELTAQNAANAEIERGTVTVSGSTITFTPVDWTCQQPTDASYSASFDIAGNTLTMGFASSVLLFDLNTASTSSAGASGFALTDGCFLQNGSFEDSPLTAVGSCHGAGGDCASTDSTCCNGFACTNGGTCAALCTVGTDCQSGCCFGAVGTVQVCAAATNCK